MIWTPRLWTPYTARERRQKARARKGGFLLWPGGDDQPCCNACTPITPQGCATCATGSQPGVVSVFFPNGTWSDDAVPPCGSAGHCAVLNGATIVMKDCRLRVDDCTRASTGLSPNCGAGTTGALGDCAYNSDGIVLCHDPVSGAPIGAQLGGGWIASLGYNFYLTILFGDPRRCGAVNGEIVWNGPSPMHAGKADCSTGHSATLSYNAGISPGPNVSAGCDVDTTKQPQVSW